MRSSCTFRRRGTRGIACATAIAGVFFSTCAAAQPGGDPAASQYIRDAWSAARGFPGGAVSAIAQTPDGYLWVGTEKGLLRFDGFEFRIERGIPGTALPITRVLGLTTDADGTLWIRLQGSRLARYRAQRFEEVVAPLVQGEAGFTAMSRDPSGRAMLTGLRGGIIRATSSGLETLAPPQRLPSSVVISLAAASGAVWLGTRDVGIFRVRDGALEEGPGGLPDRKVNSLLAATNGDLWIGTDEGVARWDGRTLTRPAVRSLDGGNQVLAAIEDRAGSIWVGTSRGLIRLRADGAVSLDDRDPSRSPVTALFEDREANLWIGTPQGIERWRARTFLTYSHGAVADSQGPLFAEGRRIWFAPSRGLAAIEGSDVTVVAVPSFDNDVVYSIDGNSSGLWIGRQHGGLTHLTNVGSGFTARTYGVADGLPQQSVFAVLAASDGSIWAGTLNGGVGRLAGGRFAKYTIADGLASNTISAIAEDRRGTIWLATPTGLSRYADGRWTTISTDDGLPSNEINTLLAADDGLWVGTAAGVALVASRAVQTPSSAPMVLKDAVHGIAADAKGWLWVATANHVLRVSRTAFLKGTLGGGDVREYGLADGLLSIETLKRQRSVVADGDGRIWFSLNRSVSVVDSRRMVDDSPPSIVHVTSVTAGGAPLPRSPLVRLPSLRQRITFGFSAISLAVPERVRYRYRLDGFDSDWSEPTAAREASYTNLEPGPYTFRVMASNSDGVWSETNDAIAIDIGRVFWRTGWFRALLAGSIALLVLAGYRFRIHQMTRQMNVRFEERLAERTRIAQDLHDTLLQGFLSASMQLHVAADALPDDSPARPGLARVAALMRQVIDEGRSAVRGLRSADASPYDLEQAFSNVPKEVGLGASTGFRVIVEGQPRPLNPLVRDEVYRIGREALVNALRHSRASTVEVQLEYAAKHLRMLVRDDGVGIEPDVLKSGSDGHWGLSGMRERAERIGARLKVFSRAAAGTEVELWVPSHIAWEAVKNRR